MEPILMLKGILIGFALAVPIGPIGILCIHKTITKSRWHGVVIGLGGATADLLYSFLAASGISAISATLENHRFWIRLIGGAVLIGLGIFTYFTHLREKKVDLKTNKLWRTYLFTIILTLTNPLTIFAFIAIFASMGIGHGILLASISSLAIGVFIGSCSWFLLLNFGANYYGSKLNRNKLQLVNKIAGILIILAGMMAIAKAV